MAAAVMLIRADARAIPLRDGCVHCVVTSPPYFGLRDYGVAGQIGLEPTPYAYVDALVDVFRDVRRVLKDDGTVWLNLGDSYAGSANSGGVNGNDGGPAVRVVGLAPKQGKPKDLLGIPWRVAFALQADGWYLRSDVIWSKPNPMPESVTDRPTKAHEYVFLLAKQERYFYDGDAIRQSFARQWGVNNGGSWAHTAQQPRGTKAGHHSGAYPLPDPRGANRRSVWTIPTLPYTGAHFATMPEALIQPCILAGCPIGGLVFDPFVGSGTVGVVAERNGRRWVGTDLTYQTLSRARTAQRGFIWS